MVRMLAMVKSVSSGGGRRLTLLEAGQPAVSCWAPTFTEAFRGLAQLDSIRTGCVATPRPQSRHEADGEVAT